MPYKLSIEHPIIGSNPTKATKVRSSYIWITTYETRAEADKALKDTLDRSMGDVTGEIEKISHTGAVTLEDSLKRGLKEAQDCNLQTLEEVWCEEWDELLKDVE